jgi:hypothetical protein
MIINEITGKTFNHIESKIVDFLQQNCSQFLNIYSKNDLRLYRGMGGPKKLIIKGKPRVYRKPLNTPLIIQRKIDKNLSKCGFTALRSNSIFATSKQKDAYMYGNPYIIFPYNFFSFTWSPLIHDLTTDFYLANLDIKNYKSHIDDYFSETIDFINDLNTMTATQWVKKYKFMNNHIEWAIASGNEILFNSPFVAISADATELLNKITEAII